MYGEVVDHRNGTYSVTLLLPWEGQAQVFVRLEHSSEVVQILKKYRESSFPRSHYNGHFEGSGPNKTRISEVVQCNLKWGAEESWRRGNCCCEYKDLKQGRCGSVRDPRNCPVTNWFITPGEVWKPINPVEKLISQSK